MSVKKVLSCIRKADIDYGLINNGDRIGVGISGGKDSNLLLYALYLYRFLSKNTFDKQFDIIGIHIDLNFGEEDFSKIETWFKDYPLTIHKEKARIADILSMYPKNGKIQCSRCSTLKKGAVIKAAKMLGCNKVAFAHHFDDAIETLFLNMIYGGRIATFDPKMFLTNQEITFIRPFCYAYEKDIRKACKDIDLPSIKSGCPNDGYTKRQEMKELVHALYHRYPQAKDNFRLALHNEDKLNLWHKEKPE